MDEHSLTTSLNADSLSTDHPAVGHGHTAFVEAQGWPACKRPVI